MECADMNLDQYPSTYSDGLREELADFYGLQRDNFVVGNGSDEMLDILFKTFMEPGETVITAYPAYSLHGFFVKINGGNVTQIDLDDDFQLNVEGINSAKGKMVIICTPNNPTSNLFRQEDVRAVVEGCDRPVVVDEAYGEFAGESFMPLVDKYENLIVTRTFSKAYGLAGMRIGYMASNLDHGQRDADRQDPLFAEPGVRACGHCRAQGPELRPPERRHGEPGTQTPGRWSVARSGSTCSHQRRTSSCSAHPRTRPSWYARLAQKDVLIRDFGKHRRLENCVRTTIGTREMNDELLAKLREVVSEW